MFKLPSKILTWGILLTILIVPFRASAAPSRYVSNQTIFNEMVSHIMQVDSYNFEGKFSVNLPQQMDYRDSFFQSNDFWVSFYGSKDKNRITGDERSAMSVTLGDSRGVTAYPHLDIVTDNKDTYLKVSDLSWVADWLAFLDADFSAPIITSTTSTPQSNLQKYGLDKVQDKWIKSTDQSSQQFMSELGFSDEMLEAFQLQQANSQKEAMDKFNMVLKTAKKYNLLTFTRLKDEMMSGVDTYHLKVVVNKNRIRPVLGEINNKMPKDERMTVKELNAAVKDLVEAPLPTMEVWVGKDDYLPRKLVINFDIKESSVKNAPSVKLNFSLLLSGFNNVQMITVPTEYRPIEEVVGEFIKNIEELDKNRRSTYGNDDLSARSTPRPVFNLPLMSVLN